ncbi:penicillin-binding transpeptidase domain-containing protein [Nocardiopsis potens]|uniref:penicillin-binding transpeptidase domain-containing protein n=1 Tax=Nocardiopsis potens TaxID=1246458 RepID=UPI000361E881|nr:penicillin-binding transpeptidase domain-containing protein [Nocardiopsis potens]
MDDRWTPDEGASRPSPHDRGAGEGDGARPAPPEGPQDSPAPRRNPYVIPSADAQKPAAERPYTPPAGPWPPQEPAVAPDGRPAPSAPEEAPPAGAAVFPGSAGAAPSEDAAAAPAEDAGAAPAAGGHGAPSAPEAPARDEGFSWLSPAPQGPGAAAEPPANEPAPADPEATMPASGRAPEPAAGPATPWADDPWPSVPGATTPPEPPANEPAPADPEATMPASGRTPEPAAGPATPWADDPWPSVPGATTPPEPPTAHAPTGQGDPEATMPVGGAAPGSGGPSAADAFAHRATSEPVHEPAYEQAYEPASARAAADTAAPAGAPSAPYEEPGYLDETSNPAFPPPGGPPAGGAPPNGTPPFGSAPFGAAGGAASGAPAGGPDSGPHGSLSGDGRAFPPPPAPPGPGGPHRGEGVPAPAPQAPEGPEEKKRSRKGLLIGIGAGVLVLALAGGVTGWYVLARPSGPEQAAASYAGAWSEQDYKAMSALTAGGGVQDVLGPLQENLGVEKSSIEVGEVVEEGDDAAEAPFTATLSLSNAGDWTYEGSFSLIRDGAEWKVDFEPSSVHPDLTEGTTLVRANVWGERGHILAADGSRLDTEDASGSVQMLTGQVGAATAEDLERLGPAYKEGDPTGLGGIQQQYEERLAGEVSTSIRVAETGSEEEAAADPDAPVVGTVKGRPGKDVTTAIDPELQSAAAAAVSTGGKPTALVAVRASTGEVVAVANNSADFNRAFDGQYAPGSSFKIVTYESLLEKGLSPSDTMSCPKEALGFKNAGDAAYGEQSVTEAFATSCNTALVQDVVNRISGADLTATAELFGMNADLNIGVPTREPSFPDPAGDSGLLAAQSIGQGQIISTPLHMATVPAAIADGSWRSPALVTDPELPDKPKPAAIPHAEALRPMMRAVVTEGTAKKAGFQGEVYGKTGSAEFGTATGEDDELATHAWMVGYKGDIAFAVVVEGGGGGGSVAGPVGAKFTNTF